ncbi:LPS-assembly protein LptD [Rhodobacter calidifons]|uniref:LPS-assembly protein LptD n=1 Tax=Rhodobacter calidifons TaxID=2715277 RepID=A0ABX0G841_9RHOB|nr:LPS assembly protein LptD [Rhodobacter calidifons]NHB77314.1 LPS-assembly protein LptD [Rhodobacter calidifons]
MRRLLILFAALAAFALPALAQDRATLVSDSLRITGDTRLIAEGNVEVFFKGRRLKASRIVFDQQTDRLEISGPIVLTEETGQTLILASQAELAADLSEGILSSARLVLNQQLQLAANRMVRVAGRYTALQSVAASSCKVCEGDPTPLWEIRARRVVHDEEARQIYFDRAQFRLAGVPVFYIPRLRMPDPTLKRATGFLMPGIRTTSDLGTGIRLPYFIVIGKSADLTLTPYLTARQSQTLGLRYRQAFATGLIEATGSVTRDRLFPGETRGYLRLQGSFALPRRFMLTFDGQTVSDPAYMLDYGLGNADRLDSRIEIRRTRRNEHIAARIISFQTLREDESDSSIPSLVADLTFHRRFSLGPLGGEGGLRLQTHNQYRSSNDPFDGPDSDDIPDGRDIGRISARIDWRRSFVLPAGIEATVLGEATADAYTITDDATYAGSTTRTHAAAGAELRWPWVKAGSGGATHVIEPVVQLIYATKPAETIPNEDSALVEFDEASLFALDRFPGSDAVERGTRANIGIGWTRHDPAGWSLGVTLGRVIRKADLGQFGPGSGFAGARSDWLAAANLTLADGLALTGRLVLDDDLSLTKAEARLALNGPKTALATSLIWAVRDLLENRPDPTREITFDARRRVTPNWTANFSGRYDFVADRGTVAGLGLGFQNECVRLDVSLSRRFTSSTSVNPTTDFELSLDLIGFGGGATAGPARSCRQ